MIRHITITLLATLLLTGCGKKTDNAQPTEAGTAANTESLATPPESPAMQIIRGEMAPETVIAQVGDAALTAGTAKMLIEFRIASIINQIPPERIEPIKASMLQSTIEQFIEKTVLLQEAKKRNIEVTPEDTEKALAEVASQLPDGMTIDQAMDQSPWGRENLMNEMTASIRTRKLIDELTNVDISVTEEEADAFYIENKDRLDQPERISARHILIAAAENDTPEIKAEKKKQIEDIRQKIVDGADFAEMATQHSVCSSGKMGGALGEFNRESRFLPEFKEAAFNQDLNEIGPVVETEAGYHIIQVTDKKDAETMPEEKVMEIVKRQKAGMLVRNFISELREKADIKYPIQL